MVRTYETDRETDREIARRSANVWLRAFVAAVVSAVLGLAATWVAGFVIPFPWEFGTALLAVGVASFASALFSVGLSYPKV